jgi:hypothetical protein
VRLPTSSPNYGETPALACSFVLCFSMRAVTTDANAAHAFERAMPAVVLLSGPDLVEFEQRSFEFAVEQPHRIEDFAERCRCPGSVGAPKREDAVVSQKSHDPRL